MACPVCKLELTGAQVKPPTRIILHLIGEIKMECKKCKMRLNYKDAASYVCLPAPHPQFQLEHHTLNLCPGAVVPAVPIQPAAAVPTLQGAVDELRQGKVSAEVEKCGPLFVKSKLKASSDGRSALLNTQGKVTNRYSKFKSDLHVKEHNVLSIHNHDLKKSSPPGLFKYHKLRSPVLK